jgi:hypothetical protein
MLVLSGEAASCQMTFGLTVLCSILLQLRCAVCCLLPQVRSTVACTFTTAEDSLGVLGHCMLRTHYWVYQGTAEDSLAGYFSGAGGVLKS